MLNAPLLWISGLFYVALVSALYLASASIIGVLLLSKKEPSFPSQKVRKRLILTGLVLPPLLAFVSTIAGATLRHIHNAAWGSASKETMTMAHHAMACEQFYHRLALLGGLGTTGHLGQIVSAVIGGAAWVLLLSGFIAIFRLVRATKRLEFGLTALVHPPSPRLAASLERVACLLPALPVHRFFECPLPAAFSSVLGLHRARCVLSHHLVRNASEAELDAVVAHEASHLKNGDVLATFIVGLLNCLFFFLRPVSLLSRWWREAAELACDEAAVRATSNPLAMASAILRVSGVLPLPAGTSSSVREIINNMPAVVLSFADEAACLPAKRVERLLHQAQRAIQLSSQHENRTSVVAGWFITITFGFVGAGLLFSSEAACVTHCTLELVQHLL